jgi:2,4-diaminopentanoate dehydrogenase
LAPTKLHKSTIAAGTVGGQRVSITGIRNGKPLLRFRSNWFATTQLEPEWSLPGEDGWRVVMEADAPVEMTIRLPMPVDEQVRASGRYTAFRPVNAIPYVVAAAPGIVPTTELAQVIANLK